MAEIVLNTNTLPEPLFRLIRAPKVRVREVDGIVQLMPVKETPDCTAGLRGLFAGDPEMTVDKFLERKHADKSFAVSMPRMARQEEMAGVASPIENFPYTEA